MSKLKNASKKKAPATKPVNKSQKPTERPEKDEEGDGKDKKQRSFRLTNDAFDVLKVVTDNKKRHGMTQATFVAKAICKYGKEILGDAFPALREIPAEYMTTRLEYLERMVVKQRWNELTKAAPLRTKDLTSMIQKFQFEPYAVDMETANAWRKKHGEIQDKKFRRDDVITASYARKLGLLAEDDDE